MTASKGRFLAFLNFISIAGIAIGVAALIIVIGIMTGFGNNIREKIIGTTPHILIEKEVGVKDFDQVREQLMTVEGVKGASAYVQGNVFLENTSQAIGILVRGVDPALEHQVTKVNQYMVEGNFSDLKDDGVVIGKELARYFGYKLGDTITLISPGSGLAGEGWRYNLTIKGVFSSGMIDYDTQLVLVNIKKAQTIFNLNDNTSTGVGVRLSDPYKAQEVKESIYRVLGYGFLVKTWIDINHNLFEALFLEKWGLFIVLTLMVIIASFSIVSALIVMVTTKTHDIGILKSIGATNKSIRKIFVKQGLWIGTLGTFWGLVIGVGLGYILKTYVKVPQEIYSIEHVPIEIHAFDVCTIVLAAFIISYVATIYPSIKAANLQPVEALRYE